MPGAGAPPVITHSDLSFHHKGFKLHKEHKSPMQGSLVLTGGQGKSCLLLPVSRVELCSFLLCSQGREPR